MYTKMDFEREMSLGEPCISKIKKLFFPDMPWDVKLCWKIGENLAIIKQTMRKFYPDLTESERLEILHGFSDQDYLDFDNV
jgi:hypothetical protein